MNEPVQEGDIVMIISDNFNTTSRLYDGDICKISMYGDLFEATALNRHSRWQTKDDLGYYTYKKLNSPLWKLII